MTPPTVSDLERVAQWMMANGYATGHGDTVEDMLVELEWQAMARGAKRARECGVTECAAG